MRYRKEFVSIWKIDIFLFVAFLTENLYDKKTKNPVRKLDIRCLHFTAVSSQSELRLPLLQVVSSNKYFSVGVQSPTEINAPRGCAVILKRRCQLALTRITHQVSRAFDLNALTPTSYKSWSVPVRAKPCETQSLTESLSLTGFFVFSIYSIKVSQCTRLHFVSHYNDIYIIENSACNTERIISMYICMRGTKCRVAQKFTKFTA